MRHLKKENIICFTAYELSELYKKDKKEKLSKALKEKNYSWKELNSNYKKKNEVVHSSIKKDLKCKEQIEILSALNSCIVFYGEDSEVCFPLEDSYSLEKNPIRDILNLKKFTKQDSLIDFSIISSSRIYNFQFKQYKGKLGTKDLFKFIEKKLKRYGNKIKNVNLLIIIQGPVSIDLPKLNINFKKIREKLNLKGLDFSSSILVRFNERNKFDHLIEIYPSDSEIKIPIDPNYLAGRLLYY